MAAERLLEAYYGKEEESGVALVTTLLLPAGGGAVLRSFVRWHLAIGFERVYLFFDDKNNESPAGWEEVSAASDEKRVVRFRRGRSESYESLASYGKFGEFFESEPQARQVLNADYASTLAKKDGFKWLVHLDVDEAFFASSRETFHKHFGDLEAANVARCTYANHEGVPERVSRDYFKGVRLFKRNHFCVPLSAPAHEAMTFWKKRTKKGQYLLCYDNGKSAVRLVEDIKPTSVHSWSVPSTYATKTALASDPRHLDVREQGLEASFDEPCVLHYVVCGLFWLETKYAILGDFPDAWFGGKLPIAPNFHLDARDTFKSRDEDALRQLYASHVAAPTQDIIEDHIKAQVCRRYHLIADFLALFEDTKDDSHEVVKEEQQQSSTERIIDSGLPPTTPASSTGENPTKKPQDDALRAWILSSAAQSYL